MKKQLMLVLVAGFTAVNAKVDFSAVTHAVNHKNIVHNKSGLDLVVETRYLAGPKVHKQINRNAVGDFSKGAACINEIVVFDMSGNQLYNHYIGGNKCTSHTFVIYNENQPKQKVKGKIQAKRKPVAPKIRVDW